MGYDSKCYQLAYIFLADHGKEGDANLCALLAQEIQDRIEDFILEWVPPD